MNNNNYITIQGWMRTELDLKGNDLLVYAIIYGFSQTDSQRFTGGLQYLADWCGATKQGIMKNLNNLLERELIQKEERIVNNIKLVDYYTTQLHTPLNSVAYPIQLSLTNNIDNNKENKKNNNKLLLEISEDDVSDKLYSNEKPKKKKKNVYEKCVDVIDEYTDIPELREVLIDFLKFRLSVKDKPLYTNVWKALLKKLDSIVKSTGDEYIDIVQQSIDKGWISFYEIKKYSKKKDIQTVSSEFGLVSCDKADDEEMIDVDF